MQTTTQKGLVYYKRNITSLAMLQANCMRIAADMRMGAKLKQQYIANMFNSFCIYGDV